MKSISLLSLDMLRKQELAVMRGGQIAIQAVCGCVCVGLADIEEILDTDSSDGDCADCGASNAHRVSN